MLLYVILYNILSVAFPLMTMSVLSGASRQQWENNFPLPINYVGIMHLSNLVEKIMTIVIDDRFYDNPVKRLREKARHDLISETKPHLLNTRRRIVDLLRKMKHYLDIPRIKTQHEQLTAAQAKVNAKITELTQRDVRTHVVSAETNVRFALDLVDNPPWGERDQPEWLVGRIHSLSRQALFTLKELNETPYYKPSLAAHSSSIKEIHTQATQLLQLDHKELCRRITDRQATLAAAQIAEERRQQVEAAARARKEQEAIQKDIETKASRVPTLVDQFQTAVRSKDLTTATQIYQQLFLLGTAVHVHCFHNQEMACMNARLKSMRHEKNSGKIPVLS